MKTYWLTIATLVVFSAIGTGQSFGALITVANPSFEERVLNPGDWTTFGDGLHGQGWTVSLPLPQYTGILYPTSGQYPVPDGNNVVYSWGGGTISQVLSDSLAANTEYTLAVEVGDAKDPPWPAGPIPFGGYTIQLLAGGNLLAEDVNGVTPADGSFTTATVNFTALSGNPYLGQPLEIRLMSGGWETSFDHVQLQANAIPEPSSLALLGIGAVGMAVLRRHKKRAAAEEEEFAG